MKRIKKGLPLRMLTLLTPAILLVSCGEQTRLKQELSKVRTEILETENQRKPMQQQSVQTREMVQKLERSVAASERESNDTNGRGATVMKEKQRLESVLKSAEEQISNLTKDRESYTAKYLKQ